MSRSTCERCRKRYYIVITYMEEDGDRTYCKYCALEHEDEVMGYGLLKEKFREEILAAYSGRQPGA